MISQSTKLILCDLLLSTAKIEKDIEVIRQLLCGFKTFHPYIAFKNIDNINNNTKGYLDVNDICKVLEKNGFQTNLSECRIFIKLYDQDSDGTISYSEYQ